MSLATRDTALHALVPVERLLRRATPDDVADLLDLRAALESTAGRTVTRGRAARFLGITQTSVDRWIADGAIPTVIDVDGRTTVPTRELVRVRVEMDEERARGLQRPLGAVVRRRREEAAALPLEAIVTPQLRKARRASDHRRAEAADLAVHRLIARSLTEKDIAVARWQLERSAAEGLTHATWAERWRELLSGPVDDVRAVLMADDPAAARMRQTSPFKGVIRHDHRRAVLASLDGAV